MGSGFLAVLLWWILFTVDWEKEVRRAHFRSDRRRKNELDIVSIPRPGSFSVGSVPIPHVLGEAEDIEMREIELVEFGSAMDPAVLTMEQGASTNSAKFLV
jgi:hypothetical protein